MCKIQIIKIYDATAGPERDLPQRQFIAFRGERICPNSPASGPLPRSSRHPFRHHKFLPTSIPLPTCTQNWVWLESRLRPQTLHGLPNRCGRICQIRWNRFKQLQQVRSACGKATIITPNAPPSWPLPRRQHADGPTTFAPARRAELPVVREYSAGGLVIRRQGPRSDHRTTRVAAGIWVVPAEGHIEKGRNTTANRRSRSSRGNRHLVRSGQFHRHRSTTGSPGTSQRVHKLVHHSHCVRSAAS